MSVYRFSKPLEKKTPEELIAQIRRLQDIISFERSQKQAQQNAYLNRLGNFRKAKALANRRADKAEAALKALTEKFFGEEND